MQRATENLLSFSNEFDFHSPLYTDFQFLLMAERKFQQPFSHGDTEGTEERHKTEIGFWLFLREQLVVCFSDLAFSLRASVSP